jgi:hypothetical protein
MIGFIKHKIWVSQLAQTHETYDNRDIERYKPYPNNTLNNITDSRFSIFTRATT